MPLSNLSETPAAGGAGQDVEKEAYTMSVFSSTSLVP